MCRRRGRRSRATRARCSRPRATLSADTQALALVRASLAAARAKQSVECAGVNSAQGAASSPTGPSGACASDAQSVATDEQSLSGAVAKVAGDQAQVSAAERALAGDRATLAAAQSSSAIYGQSSTYTTLPAVGQIVRRGQSLYAISGKPVVLFYGPVAAVAGVRPGMSAGRDVAELNANLSALGYGKGLDGRQIHCRDGGRDRRLPVGARPAPDRRAAARLGRVRAGRRCG